MKKTAKKRRRSQKGNGINLKAEEREKILKRIEELEIEIAVDEELSHGMHPDDAYDWYYEEIDRLKKQIGMVEDYGELPPIDDELPFK